MVSQQFCGGQCDVGRGKTQGGGVRGIKLGKIKALSKEPNAATRVAANFPTNKEKRRVTIA